ncbi:MAG TPA: hypothetical protein VF015_11860 [Acidimicrobiales bacterium]
MRRVDWAADQRELELAREARTDRAERRRVKILWWTDRAGPRHPDVVGAVARLWSGRRRDTEQVFVALYQATDPPGARPFLVVRARPGCVAQPRGRALATVVGRAEPGGALVIETSRGQVVPAEPPARPGDLAPAWSEVDAPR